MTTSLTISVGAEVEYNSGHAMTLRRWCAQGRDRTLRRCSVPPFYTQLSLVDGQMDRRFKTCRTCGGWFRVKPHLYDQRTYCSRRCMAVDYRQRQSGEDNPNFRDAFRRTCEHCGGEYHTYTKDRRHCSHRCARAALLARSTYTRVCEHCGMEFITPISHKRYCSRRCSRWKERVCAPKPARPAKRCRRCGVALESRKRVVCDGCLAARLIPEYPCVVCGALFRASNRKKACSPQCRRAHRSLIQQGSQSHRWKGGRTAKVVLFRQSLPYTQRRWPARSPGAAGRRAVDRTDGPCSISRAACRHGGRRGGGAMSTGVYDCYVRSEHD